MATSLDAVGKARARQMVKEAGGPKQWLKARGFRFTVAAATGREWLQPPARGFT